MPEPYFTHRQLSRQPDYESAYWGMIVDPDGKARDRLEEREKHLEDVKQELGFLNSLAPGRLVDIGCGLGYLLSGLDLKWERHGVEVSRFAAEHASQWGQIFVGELAAAGYAENSFDAVVMHHVIEHLEDPESAIREVRRILRPGGHLILGTPDFDSGCARRFGPKYRLLHDPTHVSLFTNESMRRFLSDHGFLIDRVEFPYFETRYFTPDNLMRLFDTDQISPPFYGNFMTFYCRKSSLDAAYQILIDLSRMARQAAEAAEDEIGHAADLIAAKLMAQGRLVVCAQDSCVAQPQAAIDELLRQLKTNGLPQPAIAQPVNAFDARDFAGWPNSASAGDVLVAFCPDGMPANLADVLQSAKEKSVASVIFCARPERPLAAGDAWINLPSGAQQSKEVIYPSIWRALCAAVVTRLLDGDQTGKAGKQEEQNAS